MISKYFQMWLEPLWFDTHKWLDLWLSSNVWWQRRAWPRFSFGLQRNANLSCNSRPSLRLLRGPNASWSFQRSKPKFLPFEFHSCSSKMWRIKSIVRVSRSSMLPFLKCGTKLNTSNIFFGFSYLLASTLCSRRDRTRESKSNWTRHSRKAK